MTGSEPDPLISILRRHLPKSDEPILEKWRLEHWSERLRDSKLHANGRFGVSSDHVALDELSRLTGRIVEVLKGLEPGRQLKSRPELRQLGPGACLMDARIRTMQIHEAVMAERKAVRKMSEVGRRNWPAASVVAEARKIWAEAYWFASQNGASGYLNALAIATLSEAEIERARRDERDFLQHVQDFAPRFVNANRPGPFGNFVEDIFLALKITRKDGEELVAVSAATALNALNQATK